MPSTLVCASCRQILRLQFRHLRPSKTQGAHTTPSIRNPSRPFSTGRLLSASQPTPKAYQPKPPPAHPAAAGVQNGDSPQRKPTDSPSTAAPSLSIAKELHKRASSVTETYVAYGVCEALVKECARQADYTIPQAREKDVDVPKTKEGEDLGVGTGWWFDSEQIWLSYGELCLHC